LVVYDFVVCPEGWDNIDNSEEKGRVEEAHRFTDCIRRGYDFVCAWKENLMVHK